MKEMSAFVIRYGIPLNAQPNAICQLIKTFIHIVQVWFILHSSYYKTSNNLSQGWERRVGGGQGPSLVHHGRVRGAGAALGGRPQRQDGALHLDHRRRGVLSALPGAKCGRGRGDHQVLLI